MIPESTGESPTPLDEDRRLGGDCPRTACSRSSETPETDAVEFEVIDDYECGINVVSSGLARKLERERNALAITYGRSLAEIMDERDQLRAAIRNLRDVSGRHHTEIATKRLFALLPENDKADPLHGRGKTQPEK